MSKRKAERYEKTLLRRFKALCHHQSTRKTHAIWKFIICLAEERYGRHKALRGQKKISHEGIKFFQGPRACKTCRNSIIPGVVAMVTYRGHVIVRRDPENLEASTTYDFIRKAVETGWKQRERQGQPRYVE